MPSIVPHFEPKVNAGSQAPQTSVPTERQATFGMLRSIVVSVVVGYIEAFSFAVYTFANCTGTAQVFTLSLGKCVPYFGGYYGFTLPKCNAIGCDVVMINSIDCVGQYYIAPITLPYDGSCVATSEFMGTGPGGGPKGLMAIDPNPMPDLSVVSLCQGGQNCASPCYNYTVLKSGCTPMVVDRDVQTGAQLMLGQAFLTSPSSGGAGGSGVTLANYYNPNCSGTTPYSTVTLPDSGSCAIFSPASYGSALASGPPGRFLPNMVDEILPADHDLQCWQGLYDPTGVPAQYPAPGGPVILGARLCMTYLFVCTSTAMPGCTPAKVAAGATSGPYYSGGSIQTYASVKASKGYYLNVTACNTDNCNVGPGDVPIPPPASPVDLACWVGFGDQATKSAGRIKDARYCVYTYFDCYTAPPEANCTSDQIANHDDVGPYVNGIPVSVWASAAMNPSLFPGFRVCITDYCNPPVTPAVSATPTITPTGTNTPTGTPSPTASLTVGASASHTPSPTPTGTPTSSDTPSRTSTATGTATGTATATVMATATSTFSTGPSQSPTPTITASGTPTSSTSKEAVGAIGVQPGTRGADMGAGAGITLLAIGGAIAVGVFLLHPNSPVTRYRNTLTRAERTRYFSKWEVVYEQTQKQKQWTTSFNPLMAAGVSGLPSQILSPAHSAQSVGLGSVAGSGRAESGNDFSGQQSLDGRNLAMSQRVQHLRRLSTAHHFAAPPMPVGTPMIVTESSDMAGHRAYANPAPVSTA